MANNFNDPYAANLVGLWDFLNGSETEDTGLDDGFAQNGHTQGGASISGDQLRTDGNGDLFDVNNNTGFDGTSTFPGNDAPFQLDTGTLVVEFTQDAHVGSSPDTIVNRGEYNDRASEGFFEVRVTKDGEVEVAHYSNGSESILSTEDGFFDEGDTVKVTYAWDDATGNTMIVENLTKGTQVTLESATTGLTMDITDNDDESWTFAAREVDDGQYSKFFNGSIDYVAIYDADVTKGSELDFIVEGTSAGELIDVAYTGDPEGDMIDNLDNDAVPPDNDDLVDAYGGDDTVRAGEGDDTVYAGSGDDSVEGEDGDDVIHGDANFVTTGREVFEWDRAPDPNGADPIDNNDNLGGGFTQDTGSVNVTFSVVDDDDDAATRFATDDQYVDGIDTGGGPADGNSSLESELNDDDEEVKYRLDFSDPVANVSFRINDIDGDGVVRVKAYDQNGDQIEISLTAGANLTLLDTDGVPGADTADSNGGYQADTSPNYSLLVEIPGPVARIEIEHGQDGDHNTGINVTDVYFDAGVLDDGPDGNDTLSGGEGDDSVYGEGGDDELRGNAGDDLLDGGDGNDSMGGAEGDDTLMGGAGNDTLTGGSGDDELDGGDGDDTIDAGSGDDTVDGGAGRNTIEGGVGNDSITGGDDGNLIDAGIEGLPDRGFPFVPGSQDPLPLNDRDTVITGDGDDTITTGDDDDVIVSGGGDDRIYAGYDDDDIDAGAGNDSIVAGEGSDTVNAGAGNDTIWGGIANPAANIRDDQGDPILDNGDDLIDAGAGDDVVYGEDDNDTIDGGAGNDTLDGGIDDDVIEGGTGDDEITGGQGADTMTGGDDQDTFLIGPDGEGVGDSVEGGEGGVDWDTLDLSNAGPIRIIYDDSLDPGGTPGEAGRVVFYDGGGYDPSNVTGEMTFIEIENVIPCFTPGTLIATPKGEVPVESLREGDTVITRDNGIQQVRWSGERTLQRSELRRAPHLRPILIRKGALGDGLPERDMLVSPQHRMLVSGDRTQLYFEESEVLVAAKHMVNHGSIQWLDPLRATYIHFMFDRHEVVLADGAWTESFQPGDQTLGAMGNAQRTEIFEIFPDLRQPAGRDSYVAARRSLKKHEARLIMR